MISPRIYIYTEREKEKDKIFGTDGGEGNILVF